MTSPGWNPDPTGRHQLRYWDGNAWTDHVSDAGTTGVDPLAAPSAPPATPPTTSPQPAAPSRPTVPGPPTAAAPPVAPGPPTTVGPPPAMHSPATSGGTGDRSRRTLLIVGGVVAVVALAAAAFFVLGGDDGADRSTARAGLQNILDDNDAPTDVRDEAVDIGPCPFEFFDRVRQPIEDADRDATDVDPDTNLVVVFLPPGEPSLTCGVFVEDDEDGYFVDVYISSMGDGEGAQDLVDLYDELSADTDIDAEVTDLGKAQGGEMIRACADQFVLPGDDPDDFIADPYCDTAWVSDGLVVGIEQFGSQSLDEEAAKNLVLLVLDEIIATLESEA